MFIKRSLLALSVMTAVAMSAAHAAPSEADLKPYAGKLPSVLGQAAENAKLQVFTKFKAEGGLDGWLVKDGNSGQYVILYTSADGNAMLAGMLINNQGQNMTQQYSQQYVPAKDYSQAFEAFTGGKAHSVVVGSKKAPAEITVLFDANCGYCKLAHRMVKPAIEAGELRVRYVPVAILSADSANKGAGLLAAKDAKAFVDADATNGKVDGSSDQVLLGKVKTNTDMMKQFGFNGTPVVLYKSKVNGEEAINISPGLPNMVEMFKKLNISGQVDKLRADPALNAHLR